MKTSPIQDSFVDCPAAAKGSLCECHGRQIAAVDVYSPNVKIMTTPYPHHGGMQRPGMPHGQPISSGPGPYPSQPIMEPAMQMHPGVSGPRAMYKKIAVLLIKWADELDELKTRDEVNA